MLLILTKLFFLGQNQARQRTANRKQHKSSRVSRVCVFLIHGSMALYTVLHRVCIVFCVLALIPAVGLLWLWLMHRPRLAVSTTERFRATSPPPVGLTTVQQKVLKQIQNDTMYYRELSPPENVRSVTPRTFKKRTPFTENNEDTYLKHRRHYLHDVIAILKHSIVASRKAVKKISATKSTLDSFPGGEATKDFVDKE